jgi:hypothetical protein
MINDNAYKYDLSSEYDVSATFNVVHISLFEKGLDSKSNPFDKRGDDADQLINTINDPLYVPIRLFTRSK